MLLWTELLLDGGTVLRNIKKQWYWWTREENVVMGGGECDDSVDGTRALWLLCDRLAEVTLLSAENK